MDYQTFRPITKPSYKKYRNNFAEHNYIYCQGTKNKKNTNRYSIIYTKSNVPQPILTSVNFHDQPRSSQQQDGNYLFFQQR